MLLQLKVNANSVPIALVGAAHSYICMILSPTVYATLAPMDLFITPVNPGTLNVVHGTIQYDIEFAKS